MYCAFIAKWCIALKNPSLKNEKYIFQTKTKKIQRKRINSVNFRFISLNCVREKYIDRMIFLFVCLSLYWLPVLTNGKSPEIVPIPDLPQIQLKNKFCFNFNCLSKISDLLEADKVSVLDFHNFICLANLLMSFY